MPNLLQRAGGVPAIEKMLREFYGLAREDDLIGPIFKRAVDDWEYHFQKVVIYWRRQTEGEPNYRQTFHKKHDRFSLKAEHFERWLSLFSETCARHFSPGVSGEFLNIAHDVAARLYMDLHKTESPRYFR